MASHLADEQSAYLRSARDQPVHWYPWGPKPFERARAENKPLLLDIGAVWCHWCHVMDHESYEDPAVAELLNREWICVKVDRDERPDVDARYQRAVQALSGQGGWPLTAFLTADGKVFFGGTYFPPDSKEGRPGFVSVLTELARLYREDPERVAKQADEITSHLKSIRPDTAAGALTPDLLTRAADAMARTFDFRNGGFGSQPKFPHPAACDFLLARWFDTREQWPYEIVERTLTGMAQGGIRDHIGGGFHRYAVDARWIVPHFEKMTYDNSELLRAYVHAAAVAAALATEGGAQLYLEVIEELVGWVVDVMSDPRGGYYASQDADVQPGDDGDYFTWTPDEVRAITDASEYEALARRYDIDDAGEMHHNPRKNVLWIKQSLEQIGAAIERSPAEVDEILATGRDKLLRARRTRPTPFVDRTLYTGWNAMMASAMLEAGAFLERPDLETHALTTLERLFEESASPDLSGGIRHAIGSAIGEILDDQVQAASAALDAYEATGNWTWVTRAEQLMEHVWQDYQAPDGGLLDVPQNRDGVGLLDHGIKPVQDAPTPSPIGVAGIALARLAEHTGNDLWRARRDTLLEQFAGGVTNLGVFGATLLRAFDWALMPVTHIVVVGADDEAAGLRGVARRIYRPRKVVTWLPPGATTTSLPAAVVAMLDGAMPRAYVCTATQCAAPVSDSAALAETLATFRVDAAE